MKSSHLTAIALGVASLAAGAIALGGCLARAGASSLDASSFLAIHADSPAQAAEPAASPTAADARAGQGEARAGGGKAAGEARAGDGKVTGEARAGDGKAGGGERDGKAGLSGEGQPGETQARAGGASRCAPGMVLVEGDYCPDVEHVCKRWLENEGRYKHYRCEEYTSAKCLSKARVHKSFCIDRDEYVPPGESLPASRQSWNDATRVCSEQGKRVCMESEWNFACEGEEMRPYPYGWKRDAEACNADRVDIYRADGQLRDLRMGAGDKPRCVSPFGVHNLSGNLEEFVSMDGTAFGGAPPKPAMKGAYWQPSRNHCRANQTAHDRFYKGTETGFRCCSDTPN